MTDRPDAHRDVDVLSDVLRSIRLTGSMLFLVETSVPGITRAPPAARFARAVLPRSQNLISYHVLVAGTCWAGLQGGAPTRLQAGDILIVPHGDAYFLAEPLDARPSYTDDEAVSFFRRMAAGHLPTVVVEGGSGAEQAQFICGFLGCDAHPFNPVLAALPRVIFFRGDARSAAQMDPLTELAVVELRGRRSGSREVLLRLSELMFVETLRVYFETSSAESGWFAGMRDAVVARALACLHGEPARAWTLETLASEVGASRSVLAERFVRLIGQPPMHYLAAWRMQHAARLLGDPAARVKTVAAAVGYESEEAFSRAFRKAVGVPPREWRGSRAA